MKKNKKIYAHYDPVDKMMDRDSVIRKTIKSINGSIDVLSNLERDPPVVMIANLEREGSYDSNGLSKEKNDIIKVAKALNEYRRSYWKLEILIKQSFLDLMKRAGYLPNRSLEIESLKNELPEALIKGDGRIWTYSLDHYRDKIAEEVGRDVKNAPVGEQTWKYLENKFKKRINMIIKKANRILPELFYLKARLRYIIGKKDVDFDTVRVKKPKVTPVSRPVKKVIVIKRPIPVPKKVKMPRKRILKKPDFHVVGPKREEK